MNKRTEMLKAKAIAEASRMALDTPRAEQALRAHLNTIIDWRSQGASWDRIAALLRDAGWRSNAGDIIGADSLRAMVSHIRRSGQLPVPETATSGTMPMYSTASRQPAQKVGPTSVPVAGGGRHEIAERIRRAALLRSGKDWS